MAFTVITQIPDPFPEIYTLRGLEAASAAYSVYCQSKTQAKELLWTLRGIKPGEKYRDTQDGVPDDLVLCDSIEVAFKAGKPTSGDKAEFICTVVYKRVNLGGGNAWPGGPAFWWLEGDEVSKPVDHDLHGLPISNVVDEPIDPPLSAYFDAETACVEQYIEAKEQFVLYNLLRPFKRKVNSVPFKGYPARTLRMRPPKVTGTDFFGDKGDPLWLVHAEFVFQETQKYFGKSYPGWVSVVVNKGKRFWHESTDQGKKFKIATDEEGNPLAESVLLNADGTAMLKEGEQTVLLDFEHYEEIDFRGLPFTD